VQVLLKKEIIQFPIPNLEEIEDMAVVTQDGLQPYWQDVLYRRIVQHNIRIVALYYTRIHGKRLGQLLNLQPSVLEEEIATMVSEGTIYAKIDRPADIIRFQKPMSAEAILTNWSSQIEQLLHLVDTTTHLIHKEQMTLSS
jgi:26S proteasome regulatory subunit N5